MEFKNIKVKQKNNGSFQKLVQKKKAELTEYFCNEEAYACNEKAIEILREALNSAGKHPAMTPEAKYLISVIDSLLRNRQPFYAHKFSEIFQPVIEHAKKESPRKAGRANKKPRVKALAYWDEWANNPGKYENQTAFCKAIVEKKFVDTDATARNWVDEFRATHPSPILEAILPKRK